MEEKKPTAWVLERKNLGGGSQEQAERKEDHALFEGPLSFQRVYKPNEWSQIPSGEIGKPDQ